MVKEVVTEGHSPQIDVRDPDRVVTVAVSGDHAAEIKQHLSCDIKDALLEEASLLKCVFQRADYAAVEAVNHWLALKLGSEGVADLVDAFLWSFQLSDDLELLSERLSRAAALVRRALPEVRRRDEEMMEQRYHSVCSGMLRDQQTTTVDECDTPEIDDAQRYRTEWSRRVLQRGGVKAPTADEVDLLIRQFKVLDDAMRRFRRVAPSGPAIDEANIVLAAAVTAFHCGHAFETGWLQQVADMIRLEIDLSNDLWGGEEQRRCNEEGEM